MIKDLVYSNVKTFQELTEDYEFQTIDDLAFLRQDLFPLGFLNAIEPTRHCYSMGKSSGIIAISRESLSIGKSHPIIEIYNAQSEKLADVSMKCYGSQAFVHVLPNDDVIAVSDSGTISRISYLKEYEITTINIPDLLINAAVFYDGGVVISTSDGNIIDVENYDTPNIMQHFENIARPRNMIAIPPSKSNTESLIIMFLDNGHLFVMDDRRYYEMKLSKYVLSIAASYDYSKIAILLDDFTIIVANQALDQIFYQTQIDLNDMEDFQMMTWIGNTVPAISFKGAVILGTEDPSSPVFFVEGSPYLFMEIDSVYAITENEGFRILAVPESAFKILNKYLVERSEGVQLCEIFDNRLTEPFVERLTTIENIPKAVSDVIETAEFVSGRDSQSYFVAVACFVNSYSNKGKGTIIGDVIHKVRVTCCLHEIGIPITIKQLEELDNTTLLMRICRREKFDLAYKLADFIGVPKHIVADEQVRHAINTINDDGQVVSSLNLDSIRPSFSAELAWQAGRSDLGVMFAELELDYAKRAVLLARMSQWQKAVNAAADTCDSSSLLSVIEMALNSQSEESVNQAIAQCEPAVRILMRLPRMTSPVRLGNILDKIPQNVPASDAVRTFKCVQSKFTAGLDCASNFKKLAECQNEIAAKTGDISVNNKSFNDTLRNFFKRGDDDGAVQFAKKFGVDEKRVDALHFSYCVKEKDWFSLKRFGLKKSRRDMWPQILSVMRTEAPSIAKEFLDGIGQIDQKYKTSMTQEYDNGHYTTKEMGVMKPIANIFNS